MGHILAMELTKDTIKGKITFQYDRYTILKETNTMFKVDRKGQEGTGDLLINCREQLRKEELNKIRHYDGLEFRNERRCGNITLKAWIVVEANNDNPWDIVSEWKAKMKQFALDELIDRRDALKALYYEIESV